MSNNQLGTGNFKLKFQHLKKNLNCLNSPSLIFSELATGMKSFPF